MRLTPLVLAALACAIAPGSLATGSCPSQPTHEYVLGGTLEGPAETVSADGPAALVDVQDTNALDCNGDGVPADWDGDYDLGVGGGAFGYLGAWDGCGYGLNPHAGTGHATDLTGLPVHGWLAIDDMAGPQVYMPVNGGGPVCETDGAVTPATDPYDCLAPWVGSWNAADCVSSSGDTGASFTGGDGLYWLYVETSAPLPAAPQPATAGLLVADW